MSANKTAATMNDAAGEYSRLCAFVSTDAKTITLTGARMNSEQGTLIRTHDADRNRYTRKQVEAFLMNLYGRVRTMGEEITFDAPVNATEPDGDTIVVSYQPAKSAWICERENSVVNDQPLPHDSDCMTDILTILSEPWKDNGKCAGVGLSLLKKDNRAIKGRRDARTLTTAVVAGKGFGSLLRVDGPFKSAKQATNKTVAALATLHGFKSTDWKERQAAFGEEAATFVYAVDENGEAFTENGTPICGQFRSRAIKEYKASLAPAPAPAQAAPQPAVEVEPTAAAPAFDEALFKRLVESGVDPSTAAKCAGSL